MRAQDKLRLRLRSLFRLGHVDRELETELSFHLDQLTEESISGGMAPDEVGRARWGAWAPPTALIVVLTIAWELVSRLGLVSTFLLPSPSAMKLGNCALIVRQDAAGLLFFSL